MKKLFTFMLLLLGVVQSTYAQELKAYAILSKDKTTLTFYYDSKMEYREKQEKEDVRCHFYDGMMSTSLDSDEERNLTTMTFDHTFANYTGLTNTASWFSYYRNLTTINGFENFNTVNVTDMNCMFEGCSRLTSLDLSNFNTENVTNMSSMFSNCSSLTSLNLSNFNTANVTNMGSMFHECSSLRSLNLSNFNTAKVTNMQGMFYKCSDLTSLNLSNFNTAKVTSMRWMFWDCSSLTSLNLSNFNTENVTNMTCMFEGCSSLTSLDVSNFNTKNVTDMSNMFEGCSSLTSLNLSIFNTANVTDMYCMFDGCSGLTSLDLSIFNTANVTDMRYMFRDCSGLTNLDVSNFNTENITNMTYMFYNCSGLTSLNVSNFNTENVTDMFSMFSLCSSLISLDVSNFNTENVTDMTYMFYNCSGLTSLNVSNFNTENVTDMFSMFQNCSKLTSFDVSNFDTKNVKYMFDMFNGCSDLTTIYCNDTWSCSSSANMFKDCTSLKGAISYDENKTDVTYANPTTGYFTKKAGGEGKVILSKTKAAIEKGKTLTLKATVTPSDLADKTVTWESSDTKIATVSSAGKVKGVKTGTATITCTSNSTGAKATCEVTVGSVKLDQTEIVVEKAKTKTLTATVYPSTLTDKSVTWTSSDTKIATVSSKGKVKGVKTGTATITCTSNATGLSTTCKVTVGSVKLDQTEAFVEKGKTVTLKATAYPSTLEDKTVTWTSSNTAVATVSSKGKVKGVRTGTATITCTSNATGLSATCEVTVGSVKLDQTEVAVNKGETVTLKATVYPSTLEDKTVTWTSSNTAVATVSSKGKVKGVRTGTATITCTSNATGLSTTCEVTVGSVILDQTEVTVKKDKTVTLKATVYPSTLADKSVTWKSSNTSIATVTAEGKVKGIKAGTATITCTSVATGLSATCTVTVTSTSGSRSMEGDDDELTGIEENVVAAEPFDVYDLSGRKVLHQVTSLDGLPDGIYIVNGKKILKKK